LRKTKYHVLCIGFILVLVVFPSFTFVAATDNTSTGDFQEDTDNDAPNFLSWYAGGEILDINVDKEFYAEIRDIDNTSTELTVVFYYSSDSFASENLSQAMIFQSQNAKQDNFTFGYTFPRQVDGVYYQFYYEVSDNARSITKYADGVGTYFDIQWGEVGAPPSPARPPGVRIPIVDTIIRIITHNLFFMILMTIVLFFLSLIAYNTYEREILNKDISFNDSLRHMIGNAKTTMVKISKAVVSGAKYVKSKVTNLASEESMEKISETGKKITVKDLSAIKSKRILSKTPDKKSHLSLKTVDKKARSMDQNLGKGLKKGETSAIFDTKSFSPFDEISDLIDF